MSEARIGYTSITPKPVWFDPLGAAYERAFRGMLWGTAVGDAWGYPTEFLTRKKILRWYGPEGPSFPLQPRVSDDTQMTMALAQALGESTTVASAEANITSHFLNWLTDPENDRAPGRTCMISLRRLQRHPRHEWTETTNTDSKGNGANMRVGPAAFVGIADNYSISDIATIQAALTHGHPTGVVAAEMTALAIRRAALTGTVHGLLDWVHDEAEVAYASMSYPYFYENEDFKRIAARRSQNFGDAKGEWAEDYQGQGRLEVYSALRRAWKATSRRSGDYTPGDDPCDHAGQGWTAEEALAVALLCIDVSAPYDPYAALKLAASTGGDSDTIGAIAGAIVGAAHGPEPYREIGTNIEARYQQGLDSVAMPGF